MEINHDLDMLSASRVLNLPAPVDPNEPARLADLNSAVEGLAWKDSVRVATQSNINLSSPGSSIDGVSMTSGDRVLVRNQSTQSENGIYIWNGAAVAMTRSLDASTSAELEQAVVTVEEGTDAATSWRQTQVNFTLGSGNVAWTQFGTSAPDATETTKGIAELATQTETNTGTDDTRIVTPLKLANYSNRKLKYTTTIGDGSTTQFDITHNLGTKDVLVSVRKASGNEDEVGCEKKRTDNNTVRLNFTVAPASNAMKVVVLG